MNYRTTDHATPGTGEPGKWRNGDMASGPAGMRNGRESREPRVQRSNKGVRMYEGTS